MRSHRLSTRAIAIVTQPAAAHRSCLHAHSRAAYSTIPTRPAIHSAKSQFPSSQPRLMTTSPALSSSSSSPQPHQPRQTPVLEPTSTTHPSLSSSESNPDATIPPSTTSTTSTSPPASPPHSTLTWNHFLHLRRIRRRYNLVSSLFCATGFSFLGASTIADVMETKGLDALAIFGLDPLLMGGLCVAGVGAVGWLVGPVIGSAVFGGVYRGLRGEIRLKEKDLFTRIKKHRVDPSNSSAGNPVPDYYGEKIGSVAQYRTWLRDQRAYNKRRANLIT